MVEEMRLGAFGLLIGVVVGISGLASLDCTPLSSNALQLEWPEEADTDMYMIELRAHPNQSVFAVQTVLETSITLLDLLPETSYFLRTRSHPSMALSEGWDWRNATQDPIMCTTLPGNPLAASAVQRTGQLATDRMSLIWGSPVCAVSEEVGVVRLGPHHLDASPEWFVDSLSYLFEPANTLGNHTVLELRADSTYAVVVRSQCSARVHTSDPVILRTAPLEGTFTPLYRVSEYTYEIDLLANHDSASKDAQAGFLTGTNDNDFFKFAQAPVSLYCIHRLEAPAAEQGRVAAYAPYVSCNGPEAAPRTHPSDPLCICDVYPDRMIALQNKTRMDSECAAPTYDNTSHTYSPGDCLCHDGAGGRSKWAIPNSSRWYVGAMPVYQPYFYWQIPKDTYPEATYLGENLSTPKAGQCNASQQLGEHGCTWRRLPRASVIHGDQLLGLGWNDTVVQHWPLHEYGPNVSEQLQHNLPVFDRGWELLRQWTIPRCCGC
eukprot:TRINITY_DN12457_c0_g1_i1.p1 TRINITY_DN12457_c0_g1~~TRINITY_DN12457_c0_g1_i1.p1  ORF type:complete len:491 (-),score=60.27 TRINITY_DN12457_c0_g1_i1:271-1743(-)